MFSCALLCALIATVVVAPSPKQVVCSFNQFFEFCFISVCEFPKLISMGLADNHFQIIRRCVDSLRLCAREINKDLFIKCDGGEFWIVGGIYEILEKVGFMFMM